jgi:transcription termination/antitermination protein NusG
VTDEPNKLAEEIAADVATNGDAESSAAALHEAAETEAADAEMAIGGDDPGLPDSPDTGDDSDMEMSSVEEPIAEEAAAYEESEDVIEEDAVEEDVIEEEAPETNKGPVYLAPPEDDDIHMDWYILKVQSNRERSIAEALERKIKVEGLDRFFDQVIVPTEKVTEFKGGKKKIVERKLYPGYIVVHMHINDDTWFAVRETSGVGDFTGAGGKPTPMLASEVSRIVQTETEETTEAPKLDIKFATGDKVKVKEGNFESFEGEVGTIDEASGRVTVMINIFGRSTPVELEYWQIEAM